jgi:flagellar motor protein MotB
MPLRAPKGFISESDSKVCQVGHPAPPWLAPYADLMTEMVCFFVILYALSAALNKDMQDASKAVKEMMEKEQIAGEVKIDKDGLKISFQEQDKMAQFQSGFSDMTPAMKAQLDLLAPKLKTIMDKGHELIVEGHTDNVPIHNDYFWSNWELSSARATTVVEYLIREHKFPPGCIAAAGYGETRPLEPNVTVEAKSKNRRVVFFVKNPPLAKNRCDTTPPGVLPPPRQPAPGAQPGEGQEASG